MKRKNTIKEDSPRICNACLGPVSDPEESLCERCISERLEHLSIEPVPKDEIRGILRKRWIDEQRIAEVSEDDRRYYARIKVTCYGWVGVDAKTSIDATRVLASMRGSKKGRDEVVKRMIGLFDGDLAPSFVVLDGVVQRREGGRRKKGGGE